MPKKNGTYTKQELREFLDRKGINYEKSENVESLRQKMRLFWLQRDSEAFAKAMKNDNPVSILPEGFFR